MAAQDSAAVQPLRPNSYFRDQPAQGHQREARFNVAREGTGSPSQSGNSTTTREYYYQLTEITANGAELSQFVSFEATSAVLGELQNRNSWVKYD